MINDKFVQLHGPFATNEELVDRIKENYPEFRGIKKLGIQSQIANICCINNNDFEIGKTGILEFDDVDVTSLFFKQGEPATTLIDCILE